MGTVPIVFIAPCHFLRHKTIIYLPHFQKAWLVLLYGCRSNTVMWKCMHSMFRVSGGEVRQRGPVMCSNISASSLLIIQHGF